VKETANLSFAGYREDAGDQHPGAGDHEAGEGAGQFHQEASRGREVQARENCRGHEVKIELHCKKRLSFFPFPSRDVTKQTLLVFKLLPARESLVIDIPAEDGKNDNLFLQCGEIHH
jgi:hypothetical protein